MFQTVARYTQHIFGDNILRGGVSARLRLDCRGQPQAWNLFRVLQPHPAAPEPGAAYSGRGVLWHATVEGGGIMQPHRVCPRGTRGER